MKNNTDFLTIKTCNGMILGESVIAKQKFNEFNICIMIIIQYMKNKLKLERNRRKKVIKMRNTKNKII